MTIYLSSVFDQARRVGQRRAESRHAVRSASHRVGSSTRSRGGGGRRDGLPAGARYDPDRGTSRSRAGCRKTTLRIARRPRVRSWR